jgi:hypothetical protein
MTLTLKFDHELKQLGTGGEAVLAVSAGARNLTCNLLRRDSLAVAFQALRLATTELADAAATDLERISSALAGRLTYLMEPIRPVELDAGACVVQMRSSPPQQDDDGRSYFELVVRRGGELSLCRYRKQSGQPREPIPANVTREVLLRLVADFCAVLD